MTPKEDVLENSSRWWSLTDKQRRQWSNRTRKSDYHRRYGITIDEYEDLLQRQFGCCAVCSRHHSAFKRRLSVDHNHKTGEVRGLLCGGCNARLAVIEDEAFLKRASSYLDGKIIYEDPDFKKEETIIERQRSGKGNPRRETRPADEGSGIPYSRASKGSDREEEVVRGFLFQERGPRGGGSGRNVDTGRRKTQQRTRVSKRLRKA